MQVVKTCMLVIARLLAVEGVIEPTEIVIHIHMLKNRLGRDQPLHHRAVARHQRQHADRTVH